MTHQEIQAGIRRGETARGWGRSDEGSMRFEGAGAPRTFGSGSELLPAQSSAPGWGAGSTFLLTTCGVVATAAYLGADWLTAPLLSMPKGVWVIGVAQAAGFAWRRRERRLSEEQTRVRAAAGLAGRKLDLEGTDVRLMLGRGIAAGLDAAEQFGSRIGGTSEPSPRLERFVERIGWPCSPLRIGLDVGPEEARALSAEESGFAVEWVAVPSGMDDATTLRRFRLDALVRHDVGECLRVVTPESAGRDGAWYDWGLSRPMTLSSLFPVRVDASQITLETAELMPGGDVRGVAALARTAAILARTTQRIGLRDRLRGRLPSTGMTTGPRAAASFWPAEDALLELASLIESAQGQDSPAWRAAARVVSGWLAATDAPVDIDTRRRLVDACVRIVPEEPEVLLRAAAMRFAAWEDRSALDALSRADRAIRDAARSGRLGETLDQLPFLQSELEMGLPGPFTLGRVAAAICLVCATSADERFMHIRGDVLDDMRYSAWLVGRDQDRAALVEVFKELAKSRDVGGGGEEVMARAA